jgi:ABC-2 type transport system ATP-binding protein
VVEVSKRFTIRGLLPGRPKGRVQALDGIDLAVPPGSIHGLMGPNGSGKSTLLRILATLIQPSSGQAFVGDAEVGAAPMAVRARIGFSTGEERSLYWRLTGRQNLEFYAALYRVADPASRIAQTLQLVDLGQLADRPVATYSQGMMRRLGLARAILHQPPVLLLDEPTRSLDPGARDHFYQLLQRLCREQQTTVLFATHDVLEAAAICDRVSVLRSGRIVRELASSDPVALRDALKDPS